MAYKRSSFSRGLLHDPELLSAALVGYEQQRQEIEEKISEIKRELGGRSTHDGQAPVGVDVAPPEKRSMSAAARRRIAAAQKKRWAAFRKSHEPATAKRTGALARVAGRPARKMSAAGRKRIAEAQKKRWAAVRAKKAAPAPKVKTAGE